MGVFAATYLCTTYLNINVVTHMFGKWEREKGEPLTPRPSVSLACCDIWHLHGSTDNCCEVQNCPV